jgi:hypothetical protein
MPIIPGERKCTHRGKEHITYRDSMQTLLLLFYGRMDEREYDFIMFRNSNSEFFDEDSLSVNFPHKVAPARMCTPLNTFERNEKKERKSMETAKVIGAALRSEVVEIVDRSKGCDQNVFLVTAKVLFLLFPLLLISHFSSYSSFIPSFYPFSPPLSREEKDAS